MFDAYVTNLGLYPERGAGAGEYLKFPTTAEEVQALFSRIGIDGKQYEEYFITDYDSDILGLTDHLGEYESLDELNYLAHLLEEMTPDELEKLEAVIDAGEYTSSVKDLINLTQKGRQSVRKLMNHHGGKNAMKYVGAPKDFDRIAKEFHVDYAFHKTGPGHYLLFFKADQADAIQAAFGKYTEKVMGRSQDRPSILGQLRQFVEQIAARPKQKEQVREAVKEER